jgi:hypothetical protein
MKNEHSERIKLQSAINAKEVYKMLLLPGQKGTEILRVADGVVRLCYDTETDSCSIGLRTTKDVEWKYISKELHDLLVKELAEQEG